jgi:hypothetical protein
VFKVFRGCIRKVGRGPGMAPLGGQEMIQGDVVGSGEKEGVADVGGLDQVEKGLIDHAGHVIARS